MKKTISGFTIVELLIVIVVIVLLAIIVAITYKGFRERAISAAHNSAAEQWDKLLQIQVARKGPLPVTSGEICLGRSSADFPARDGFGAGQCQVSQSPPYSKSHDDAYFNALSINDDMKNGLLPVSSLGGDSYRTRGVLMQAFSFGYYIFWYPQIAGNCGKGVPAGLGTPGSLDGEYCYLERNY